MLLMLLLNIICRWQHEEEQRSGIKVVVPLKRINASVRKTYFIDVLLPTAHENECTSYKYILGNKLAYVHTIDIR